jgi:hypothetical protein
LKINSQQSRRLPNRRHLLHGSAFLSLLSGEETLLLEEEGHQGLQSRALTLLTWTCPIFSRPPKAVSAPTLVSEAKNPASNKVADYNQNEDKVAEGVAGKGLRMDGESAKKPVGVEDESTTAPIPERVLLLFIILFP